MTALARTRLNPQTFPALAVFLSGGALAGAHIFQALGYAPCQMCLWQRAAHWGVLGTAAAALFLNRTPIARPRAVVAALIAMLVLSAGLGAFHAGVEWKLWPGPASCTGLTSMPAFDPDTLFSEPIRVVACDEAPWSLAGLSMAGWNAVISAIGAVAGAHALRGGRYG